MKKFDLWFASSTNSYTFFESGAHHEALLDKDAKLIWSVSAKNYNEACAKRNEYLGWEPYKPFVDPE